MNKQRVVNGAGLLLAAALLTGLPACGDKKPAADPAKAPPPEKPVSEAELTARLHKEINETQAEIDKAVKTQNKLSTEIEVLRQLLDETETELSAHQEEISRLEAQQKR